MIENRNNTRYCSANIKKSVKVIEQFYKKAEKIEVEIINAFCEKKLFGNFYKYFLNTAFLYFNEKSKLLLENGFGTIIDQIFERIEKIPIRVLIEDIHKQKIEQKLIGENAFDEYNYYQTSILSNNAYVKKICETYPVMKELILHQIFLFIEYMCEIEGALNTDQKIIEENFCNNTNFSKVLYIQMNLSDPHRGGKTVAKVTLDNGHSVIYKPRSLNKEVLLNEIYQLYMKKSAFRFKLLSVVDMQTYGWEEYIESKECNTEDEVKRYFERMGFLLFICYLFGATDIHCENIIASGEFPILIDAETIPGIVLKEVTHTAEECVRKRINNSVIRTGILPTLVWGKNGEGVVVSALGNSTKMKTPFKLPYVINEFSSDIQVVYAQKEVSIKESLPIFQGNIVGAASYCDQICYGFEEAYHLYMQLQTKLEPLIEGMLEQKCRFIFRHTQQYSMYLNISFYPQFLKSWEERYHLFENLKEQKKYIEMYQYEKMALQKLDIPIFEIDVKTGTVCDGEAMKYYLQNFSINRDYFKMHHLCESDLAYQKKCIILSLDMLTERRLPELSKDSGQEGIPCKEKIVTDIADYICSSAFIYERDISWDNIIFYDNNTWKLAPIGLDLYDGVGGIAIFLASVNRAHPSEMYEKTLKLIQNKLFHYTDDGGYSVQNLRTKDSGIFKGEGSIIYTYVLLYKITGDKKFLFYAEKHFSKFEEIILQCKNQDYLSGSAGAIIVLTKLYAETNNRKYLDVAEILGENIWKMAKKQEIGYGIVSDNDNLPPLAGMSHGASGYIMAYAYLFEKIPKTEYYERIIALMAYEDSLFEEKTGNWKDLRKKGEDKNTMAWCHGAPGIALARIKLSSIKIFANKKSVESDIDKCRSALEFNKKNDSLCLCHGLAGNFWIEKYILEMKKINCKQKSCENFNAIIDKVNNIEGILPRERYNVSLMTGITGIGFFLNDEMLCSEIFL